MRKLIAFVLVFVSVLCLASCQSKPNTPKDIDVDSVVMLYENDNNSASNVSVTITDKEIIDELLSMHNDLRTEKTSQPAADERVWIIFCKDEKHIIEWWIGTNGNDWGDALFTTYSTVLTEDYQLVKNTRNYNRIIEILNELKDQ